MTATRTKTGSIYLIMQFNNNNNNIGIIKNNNNKKKKREGIREREREIVQLTVGDKDM